MSLSGIQKSSSPTGTSGNPDARASGEILINIVRWQGHRNTMNYKPAETDQIKVLMECFRNRGWARTGPLNDRVMLMPDLKPQ